MKALFTVILLLATLFSFGQKLTKSKIDELVKAGVDKELIISLIKRDCVDFTITPELLIEWNSKVDKEIIQAIYDCKSQSKSESKTMQQTQTNIKSELVKTFEIYQFRSKRSSWKKILLELFTDKIVIKYKNNILAEIPFTELRTILAMSREISSVGFLLYSNGKNDPIGFVAAKPREIDAITTSINERIRKYREITAGDAVPNPGTQIFQNIKCFGKKGKFILSGQYLEFVPKDKGFGFKIKVNRIRGIYFVFYRDFFVFPIDKSDLGKDENWGTAISEKSNFYFSPTGMWSTNQDALNLGFELSKRDDLPIPHYIDFREWNNIFNKDGSLIM